MKQPYSILRALLFVCLLVAVAEYVALTWLIPSYVIREIQRVVGAELMVGEAQLAFPPSINFTDVRLAGNSPESAVSMQRMMVKAWWLPAAPRTLRLDTVEIELPLLRLTRASSNQILWPRLPQSQGPGRSPAGQGPAARLLQALSASWRVQIGSLHVEEGVLEFIDETLRPPFHGVFDHIAFVAGPVTTPLERAQVSFAVRANLVGSGGHAAPLYCSGWFSLSSRDLEASCQLEPLALAAFEPYYRGPAELRVYTVTLRSTSHWSARSNHLTGRIQLELLNLSEGELSIRGRTVWDIKELTGEGVPSIKGEIDVTGPLDTPRDWHAEFVPGDQHMQEKVKQLLDRNIEVIRVPFWGWRFGISLTPGSRATMADIEATSKQVQEALEILAVPGSPSAPSVGGGLAIEAAPAPVVSTDQPSGGASDATAAAVESIPPAASDTAAPSQHVEPPPASPGVFPGTSSLRDPTVAPDGSSSTGQ